MLESRRILEVIDKIGQAAPELASALHEKAQDYQYDAIQSMLTGCTP